MLAAAIPAWSAPPNVVVFLADDMGWGDLHANYPTSKLLTPNLDRLAKEGMRFTNAHASTSKCAPSRYSLISGDYQWRGTRSWGTWIFSKSSQFAAGQMSLGDILKGAGYDTAFFGKWHLGGDYYEKGSDNISRTTSTIDFSRQFQSGGLGHGFNYDFLLPSGMQDEPYMFFENDKYIGNASLLRQWLKGTYGESVIPHTGIGAPDWDSAQLSGPLLTKAIAFLDQHLATQGSGKPFLLYYSSQAGHYPYTTPVSLFGQPVRNVTKLCNRQDSIYENDVALGVLRKALTDRGLYNNTLIIFTSDNGGLDNCGHDSSGPPFRGTKSEILEGGHREPFIVEWGAGGKGKIPAGTVRGQLLSIQDIVASLAALAGVKLDATQARDSFNMLPVWLGTKGDSTPVRDHLIVEARDEAPLPPAQYFAEIEGPWKLVLRKDGAKLTVLALRNLETDSMELVDLSKSADQADRVAAMLQRFQQRYASARTAP